VNYSNKIFSIGLNSIVIVLSIWLLGCAQFHNDAFNIPPQDWNTRSSQQNVVRVIGFDKVEDIDSYRFPTYPDRIVFDSEIKASGRGSLKVIIPGKSHADTSGSWRINFSNNPYTIQFGENQEFYIQWRQRFDSFLLKHSFLGAGGFKQVIIGEGDQPNENEVGSCTDLEIVVNNGHFSGFPQLYHSCGLYWPYEAHRFVDYVPNEWMTFQVHIKLGPSGTSFDSATGKEMHGYTNSTVEMWVAREGQKSKLTHREQNLVLRTGYEGSADARYGKIWLLPYMTGKDATENHPTTFTWYDELIISTARIADPE
jgi:hypothetical protein